MSLTYVIWEDANPAQIEPQEPGRMTGPSCESIMYELISCTPHTGDRFVEDNEKVFQILHNMVSGTSFESSVKTY